MHSRELKQAGESEERIWSLAAWREAPYFNDAERAVLALTESATRIADKSDAVPDEIWEAAKGHFDEMQLGVIVLHIAVINAWNRINVTVRQPAGKLS
jgi:alkylhydroperoxidase family enzyme